MTMSTKAFAAAVSCVALAQHAAVGQTIGDGPAVTTHFNQFDIESGRVNLKQLRAQGKLLFEARFNMFDGAGRPAVTGINVPRLADQPEFTRVSGPDANSCVGCHNQPRSGGAGDFVSNVFEQAQRLDPVTESISRVLSNERNTPSLMGSGPIEMLAREMSTELIAIRTAARAAAAASGVAETRDLVAKGVSFGRITVLPDGKVDPTEIVGVDWDLIVKPFDHKGTVVSLRQFSGNSMIQHHGMQPIERVGPQDLDQDGASNELTAGDMTAIAIFQAALNVPGQVLPKERARADAARRGQVVFANIGCTACHVPSFTLNSRDFTEPNPFNPPGNITPADVARVFRFDMTRDGEKPVLERGRVANTAIIRPFTDLKRHNLTDPATQHFNNEVVPQGSLVGFANPADFTIPAQPRPTNQFLTRKLWDVGSTAPYGHRGDLTTLTEAIWAHGGDAAVSRQNFETLPAGDRDAVIEFLKSLQVRPGSG